MKRKKKSRLKAARERKGYSQSELSRRTGIPQNTIYEIENLRHPPSLERAARLYHYLGLELEDALEDFEIASRPRGGVRDTVVTRSDGLKTV